MLFPLFNRFAHLSDLEFITPTQRVVLACPALGSSSGQTALPSELDPGIR